MRFDHLYTPKNGVRVHFSHAEKWGQSTFFRVFTRSNPTATPSDIATLLITQHAMVFINKVL